MQLQPAFVISGIDDRWQHTRDVLQAVGFAKPHRFVPVEASQANADAESRAEAYDAVVNTSSIVSQRQLAIRATFFRLFQAVAVLSIEEDDFAYLFEDDVAVHPSVSRRKLASILDFSSSLARKDGLLYLGSCAPQCDGKLTRTHDEVTYAKCSCFCTHALAVTRRRARSLAGDLHSNMVEHGIVSSTSHVHDDLLRHYSMYRNFSWVAGINLVSPENAGHLGVFYQNRLRFPSLVDN